MSDLGHSADSEGLQQAYRWESAAGMSSVADWLAAHDVVLDGARLTEATGISDDGNVVVGQMEHESWLRAYIARVIPDEPGGSGVMDVAEYQSTLYLAAELDHAVSESLTLSTSLHLATNGRDPTIAASVGVRAIF